MTFNINQIKRDRVGPPVEIHIFGSDCFIRVDYWKSSEAEHFNVSIIFIAPYLSFIKRFPPDEKGFKEAVNSMYDIIEFLSELDKGFEEEGHRFYWSDRATARKILSNILEDKGYRFIDD